MRGIGKTRKIFLITDNFCPSEEFGKLVTEQVMRDHHLYGPALVFKGDYGNVPAEFLSGLERNSVIVWITVSPDKTKYDYKIFKGKQLTKIRKLLENSASLSSWEALKDLA